MRRAGPPGWRPGPAGCCRPLGGTEAEQKVVFGRKVGQALRSLGRAVAVSAESARCWAGGRAPPRPTRARQCPVPTAEAQRGPPAVRQRVGSGGEWG